jgi:hypothetical protein
MSEGRQIMFVVDAGIGEAFMEVGDVADLADRLRHAHYGDEVDITEVYALSQLNELKPVAWRITGANHYDDNSMAYPVLTVTFPDGGTEQATYAIDGRA